MDDVFKTSCNIAHVIKQANAPPSLKKELHRAMAGYERGRKLNHIHVSEILRPEFCPRKYALAWKQPHPVEEHPRFLPTASQHTYSMGWSIQEMVTEKWGRDLAVGHWHCKGCPNTHWGHYRTCSQCGRGMKYAEFEVRDEATRVVGHIDLMVDLGLPLWSVVECKIISPTEFAKLKGPQPEHRLRTLLYLRYARAMGVPQIDTSRAVVLYVNRAHGTKDEEVKAYPFYDYGLSPFKEFWVSETPSSQEILDEAQKRAEVPIQYHTGITELPERVCQTVNCKTAKDCVMREACFGDHS